MKHKLSASTRHCLCLTALLTLLCTALVIIKTFAPFFILPRITITLLIGLSLVSQVLENWIFRTGGATEYLDTGLLTALVFAVLTGAVGLADFSGACRVGIYGGAIYTVSLLVFRAMAAQLESAAVKNRRLALTAAALLLLLASQSLAGIPVLV